MTESKSQFAKRIHRAPSYITELIQQGRLVLTPDGKKVMVEESLQRLADTAVQTKPAVAARHEAERKQGRKKRATAVINEGSRQYYELQLQAIKNQQKILDFELATGKRFAMQDVRREAQAIGNTLRASLERLVDQTAPRLAVMNDKKAREQLIATEIVNLRRVIKAEFPRALRRMRRG